MGQNRCDAGLELESGDELAQGLRLPLDPGALDSLAVEFRAALVLSGDLDAVESPNVFEEVRDLTGVGGKRKSEDFGTAGLHLGALLGVVVDEHETVQTKLQLLGECREIGRFRRPIDAMGDTVLQPQGHIRMAAEGLQDVFFVVLAAQTKEHAGVVLGHHELLEGAARDDFFRSVLAADALPEGVVAVERNDLVGHQPQGVDLAGEQAAESGEVLGRIGDVAEHVSVGVVRLAHRIESVELGRRDEVDVRQAAQAGGDGFFRAAGEGGPFRVLEEAWGRGADGNQQRGGERLRRQAQAGDQIADGLLERLDIQEFDGSIPHPVFEAHQHNVDAAAILGQQAGGIE